ncbi:aromatic prenyltransferase [Xylariaceae sp. FL0662B]|nr:aromatic prenyltransferase [Xylariaceae sp. FL0662B]
MYVQAAQKKPRFEVIHDSIHKLPNIAAQSNILSSLGLIEEYLASKPMDWKNGARFLATDFISPDKARLKFYFRCPGTSFDDIWDYFTLGGRIPGMDDVKDRYHQFVDFLGGKANTDQQARGFNSNIPALQTANCRKVTTIYMSLDQTSPFPAPKIAFCARNFATNDRVVAQALDTWLCKNGWNNSNGAIEELVSTSL